MDDLYNDVFGSNLKKRGTGYELLVACVLKHLSKDAETTHNVFIKSPCSNDKLLTREDLKKAHAEVVSKFIPESDK